MSSQKAQRPVSRFEMRIAHREKSAWRILFVIHLLACLATAAVVGVVAWVLPLPTDPIAYYAASLPNVTFLMIVVVVVFSGLRGDSAATKISDLYIDHRVATETKSLSYVRSENKLVHLGTVLIGLAVGGTFLLGIPLLITAL